MLKSSGYLRDVCAQSGRIQSGCPDHEKDLYRSSQHRAGGCKSSAEKSRPKNSIPARALILIISPRKKPAKGAGSPPPGPSPGQSRPDRTVQAHRHPRNRQPCQNSHRPGRQENQCRIDRTRPDRPLSAMATGNHKVDGGFWVTRQTAPVAAFLVEGAIDALSAWTLADRTRVDIVNSTAGATGKVPDHGSGPNSRSGS